MNYALIEDGVVVNIIWLYEGNANEFPKGHFQQFRTLLVTFLQNCLCAI